MTAEKFLNGRVHLHCGDSLEILPKLDENTFDSCVCDPPYHLSSIVKRFGKTGSAPVKIGDINESNNLKAAYARQSAGFMGKQWDGGDVAFKIATWEKVWRVLKPGAYIVAFSSSRTFGRMSVAIEDAGFVTLPMTGWIFGQGFPKAHRVHAPGWEGFRYGGQVTKPALEPIYIGQKPFSEKTGTANVLRWGCGAMNVDACRVGTDGGTAGAGAGADIYGDGLNGVFGQLVPGLGRWPANIMTDGSPEVFAAFPDSDGQQFAVGPEHGNRETVSCYGDYGPRPDTPPRGDTGSAARFFWSSKAGADDRLGSRHPTVKPVDLIQELVRLYTPPGGIVLDCFAGTGTTAEACYREGMRCTLVERETEYQADIRRRMALCMAGPDERARESIKAKKLPEDHGPLFGGQPTLEGGG
jgi:site-specific DNA-methyltransferase (adenine-specific)